MCGSGLIWKASRVGQFRHSHKHSHSRTHAHIQTHKEPLCSGAKPKQSHQHNYLPSAPTLSSRRKVEAQYSAITRIKAHSYPLFIDVKKAQGALE